MWLPSASAPKISLNPHYKSIKYLPVPSGKPTAAKPVDEQWEQLYEGLNESGLGGKREADILLSRKVKKTEINTSQSILAEKSPAHYQYKGKYVMTAVKSGTDDHRPASGTHVRVLYERYL